MAMGWLACAVEGWSSVDDALLSVSLCETQAVDAVLNKLKKKPAPKPPKAEKNATTVLGNETGAGAANGTEAGAEKEAEVRAN